MNTRTIAFDDKFHPNGIIANVTTCHMVKSVLPYDIYQSARRLDDGGRASSGTRRAKVEPVQAHQKGESVLLRAQMEARSGIHCIREQTGDHDKRGGLKEDQRSVGRQNASDPSFILWRVTDGP